ncbi:hypothetical protein H8S95_16760 [Pontibacter sp. KCTC 32443]|uniref:hypothetical protein n=1 Tax=Pontibacter TaxID=323449 RepID=UPI00164DE655|nr:MULTISPECIES: hypothetical protein [Pontibacter]MBC5775731.1 hypothetical protein [Pontibacter sp. KCTC 32443]
MKLFNDFNQPTTGEVERLANAWCDAQIKHLPESKWLEWAKERWAKDDLDKLDGQSLTNYFLNSDLDEAESYDEFLLEVNIACAAFYYANGGKMEEGIRRFSKKTGY